MSPDNNQWALPDEVWAAACDAAEPATVASRPYERLRIRTDEHALEVVVDEPRPDFNIDNDPDADSPLNIPDDEDFEDIPQNEYTPLPEETAAEVESIIKQMRDIGFTITADDADVETGFIAAVFTPTSGVGLFRVTRVVPERAGVYQEFQELMAVLGHVDESSDAEYARRVAPREDSDSDHPVDLGMGATAYELVQDPHTYWANCDTLEDYIDMCVENGADRDEMEARDAYYHHFHPQTTWRDLTQEQEDAVVDWRDTLRETIRPALSISGTVSNHYLSRADINEDGTSIVEYTLHVGDVNRD